MGRSCQYEQFNTMGQCKKDVTPLLTHSSYVFLAPTIDSKSGTSDVIPNTQRMHLLGPISCVTLTDQAVTFNYTALRVIIGNPFYSSQYYPNANIISMIIYISVCSNLSLLYYESYHLPTITMLDGLIVLAHNYKNTNMFISYQL